MPTHTDQQQLIITVTLPVTNLKREPAKTYEAIALDLFSVTDPQDTIIQLQSMFAAYIDGDIKKGGLETINRDHLSHMTHTLGAIYQAMLDMCNIHRAKA